MQKKIISLISSCVALLIVFNNIAYSDQQSILPNPNVPPSSLKINFPGGFSTQCDKCDVKILKVELDIQETYGYDNSTKMLLRMKNSKPSEIYLPYRSALSHKHEEWYNKLTTTAKFTIYPTKDSRLCYAKGDFEYVALDILSRDGATILGINFTPGAEVMFGDNNFAFPLLKGYVMRGKGVKFVIPSKDNIIGIIPMGNTIIEKIQNK